jgi:hypothetical protein
MEQTRSAAYLWAIGAGVPTLADADIVANYDVVVRRLTELGYLPVR